MFDPHASQILGKTPQEIKTWQDDGNIVELEAVTGSVEGKTFLVELWLGQGGWIAKNFIAADNNNNNNNH